MSMTIEEQKLAIAGKLDKQIHTHWYAHSNADPDLSWIDKQNHLDDWDKLNWEREGLQICHEAERLLSKENNRLFMCKLVVITANDSGDWTFNITHATYEQRLEALCRVWWPEKWKE